MLVQFLMSRYFSGLVVGLFLSLAGPTGFAQDWRKQNTSKQFKLQRSLSSKEAANKMEFSRITEPEPTHELSVGSLQDYITTQPGYEPPEDEWADYVPPPVLPLEYFDPSDDGTSLINSAILAYISMAVYSDAADEAAFEVELEAKLLPIGADGVHAFMHPLGIEGAFVTLGDSTIVAFRGTSTGGTDLPIADHLVDINDEPYLVTVDGTEMYVHEGFWFNADSTYPEIAFTLADAFAAGQKIWVTGHSLGGALATHTALRLHYEEGITLQGLQTFGSPRTGDLAMFSKFNAPNLDGVVLHDITRRWVVDGDPATTFFAGDYIGVLKKTFIAYQHVGITDTIYTDGHGNFKVERDTGENKNMHWTIDGLAADGSGEHLWYDVALLKELVAQLTAAGDTELAEEFWFALKY